MALKRNRIPATRAVIARGAALGVAKAGGYIVDLAKQLAPYDDRSPPARPPGPPLRDSIFLAPDEPALQMRVVAGRGLPDPRALLNEYGGSTINYPAQPYLTPAYRAISVRKEVAKAIREAIK